VTRTWLDVADEPLRTALLKLKLMDEDGEGPDEDQWDGYPAERARLLAALREVDDAVVLSGDIHVSVAGEVRDDVGTLAVELTTPSLTSQNLDEKLGVEQRSAEMKAAEAAFVDAFDHVHWCELASHGYVVIDVDPARVRAEWWLVDGVLERLPGERLGAAFEVPRGEPRLVDVSSG
jgi:alkaline phosphatase D